RNKSVDLVVDGATANATVRLSAFEAAVALGLGADASSEALLDAAAPVVERLRTQLIVSAEGRPCSAQTRSTSVIEDVLVVDLHYACAAASALTFADLDLAHTNDHQTRLAVEQADTRQLFIISSAAPIELVTIGWAQTLVTFVWQGAVHLVTGYDHLLFLFTLVLGAGLIAQRQGLRPSFVSIATIVTAFTVGHSITLAVAVLGYVTVPGSIVEPAIALSIALAALLNLIRPDSGDGRPMVALVFGLVHGFGFSSVLAEFGLPAHYRAWALLSFNLGIEVAQLTLVLIALVPLVWLAKRQWYRPVVNTFGSALAALCGLLWFAERTSLI
ncbi:MAG: HupE/UreJ family protein, partial [Myxococcota bacterium]